MANHKSALKRIRSNDKRRLRNRYHAKSMRNAVKQFKLISDKKEAEEKLPEIISIIDKLAKNSVIHKNKVANIKSKLMRKVNAM